MARHYQRLFRARKRIKDKLRGIGAQYITRVTKAQLQKQLDKLFKRGLDIKFNYSDI